MIDYLSAKTHAGLTFKNEGTLENAQLEYDLGDVRRRELRAQGR